MHLLLFSNMTKLIFSSVFLFAILYTNGLHAIPALSRQEIVNTKTLLFEDTDDNVKMSNYYVTTDVGTHKLHKAQKKNWNDARKTCLNEGGHLAVINSAAEEALLLKHLRDNNLSDLWIGVHELFKKDEWISVKDERFDAIGYAHWGPGEPNNVENKEHCLVLTLRLNGLNDWNCDSESYFVCEM